MVRKNATRTGWLEYSSGMFSSWSRYFAMMEGSILVLYNKEGTDESLTDSDKYTEIDIAESGVQISVDSSKKVITITRRSSSIKLRFDTTSTASCWQKLLSDKKCAQVLGATAASMRGDGYKFTIRDVDEETVIVSIFGPPSLDGGRLLLAISYQGMSIICTSRGIENCPESRRGELIKALTLANYGMRCGGFNMDHRDGEVRFQTDLPLPEFSEHELIKMIDPLISINLRTHERYYCAIRDVRDGRKTAQIAINEVEGRGAAGNSTESSSSESVQSRAAEIVRGCFRSQSIAFVEQQPNIFVGTKTVPPADKEMSVKCQIGDVLMVLTSFFSNSPPVMRPALVEGITRANYGARMGQFIMDHRDGEILFQTEVVLPRSDSISDEELTHIVAPVVLLNAQLHQHYIPGFEAIRNGSKTALQAIADVESRPRPSTPQSMGPATTATPATHTEPVVGGEFADIILNISKITKVIGKIGRNAARGVMYHAIYASTPVVLREITLDGHRTNQYLTTVRQHVCLHHTSLVGVYGVVYGRVIERSGHLEIVEDRSKLLMVTQYCSHGSISAWLESITAGRVQYSEYLAVRLAEETAMGVSMLHAREILHQDLTVANIFINSDNHAMVSNFGLRPHLDSGTLKDAETLIKCIDTGGLSHLDAACLESGVQNKASDVFAYGVLLHQLFVTKSPTQSIYKDSDLQLALSTGNLARAADIFRQKMKAGMRPTIGNLDHLSPPVKATISRLIESCFDANPTNRPSFEEIAVTFNQVREYLDRIGANIIPTNVLAEPTTPNGSGFMAGPVSEPMLPQPPPATVFQLLPAMEKIKSGLGIDMGKKLDEAIREAAEMLGIDDEIAALKTAKEKAMRIYAEMGL